MIYDSIEQKNFIMEAVKKFPCSYEQALQLANSFGLAIQSGQVIDPKAQAKAFPPPGSPDAPEAQPKSNRKARRASKKAPAGAEGAGEGKPN